MLASKYDPTLQRGGTFSIAITSKDVNGASIDFSKYDFMNLHVRPAWVGKPGSITDAPLLALSTETGEITLPDIHTIQIDISATATAALTFNSGKYELEMVQNPDLLADPPIPVRIVDKLLFGIMSVTGEILV
jgi:hypothetical protein